MVPTLSMLMRELTWPTPVEAAQVESWQMHSQHPARRWEYGLALYALHRWETDQGRPHRRLVDVGGAGSPFAHHCEGLIIDPQESGSCALEDYMRQLPQLADVVSCLSVLEHVSHLKHFLYLVSCLVAPGGLLIMTMDCAPTPDVVPGWTDDRYHFRHMRQRIFSAGTLAWLQSYLATLRFGCFGGSPDWRTPVTPLVYDYTFASLVMVKHG